MYDRDHARTFYDAYDTNEWSRLEATAYGRLQAIMHTDFLRRYLIPGSRVLDAGSGPGRFSLVAADLGGNITLFDLSRQQLQLARNHLTEHTLLGQTQGLVEGDILALPFTDHTFDLTLCYGGALSYVCDHRRDAIREIVRVTRPGGGILVSVMSRFGAMLNLVRRAHLRELQSPVEWHVWRVIEDGDLSGIPSSKVAMNHPAMHLYAADELVSLFTEVGCDVLEVAGSNVTAFEGSTELEQVTTSEAAWQTAVELERALNQRPGLVDTGSHIILAARR